MMCNDHQSDFNEDPNAKHNCPKPIPNKRKIVAGLSIAFFYVEKNVTETFRGLECRQQNIFFLTDKS